MYDSNDVIYEDETSMIGNNNIPDHRYKQGIKYENTKYNKLQKP